MYIYRDHHFPSLQKSITMDYRKFAKARNAQLKKKKKNKANKQTSKIKPYKLYWDPAFPKRYKAEIQ